MKIESDGAECKHGLQPATCVLCNGSLERASLERHHGSGGNRSSGRKTPENSETYYGHSWSEWFEMQDAVVSYIGEKAKAGEKATYGELWGALEERLGRDLGNPHYQLPSLLGYVALEGFERTNLVLTALVIYEGRPDQPGDGFFRLAAGLGIFDEKDAPEIGQEWSQMTPAQEVFWETQVAGLFKFFAGSSGTVTKKATVLDSVDGDGGGRGEV